MIPEQIATIKLSLPLRNYGVFEDMAKKLNIQFSIVSVKPADEKPKAVRNAVTDELRKKIITRYQKHGGTAPEIKEALGLPHSTTTINRILTKEYS